MTTEDKVAVLLCPLRFLPDALDEHKLQRAWCCSWIRLRHFQVPFFTQVHPHVQGCRRWAMASYIALHSLSSPITMEDNRWIVTVILIAFSLLVSQRLGEETAGEERKEERRKERRKERKTTSTPFFISFFPQNIISDFHSFSPCQTVLATSVDHCFF